MRGLIESAVLRPKVFAPFADHLAAGMATRHGGVSQPPFSSLNLASSGDDPEQAREENRRRFSAALGFEAHQLVRSKQVHGTEILKAETGGLYEGYDASITAQNGLLLAASVADCVPILIYDHANRAVAAVHSGWKGTVAQLVAKTLQLLQSEYGTKAGDCYAYIGPCIDVRDFEVGEEVAAQFDPAFKQWDAQRGKFMVDLKVANAAQLEAFGIPKDQVEVSPCSTVRDNAHFFSYRLENGVTGRHLAAIGLF
jgi:polyphenol oxidase